MEQLPFLLVSPLALSVLRCPSPKANYDQSKRDGVNRSLEPSLLFELAKKNDITLPSSSTDAAFASVGTLQERYGRFTSLDDFLHYYFIGMSVLVHETDFESLAYNYFEKAHSQNVLHAEVFFDPQAHTVRGVPYETVVSGFTKAQTRAKQDFNLTSELIVCLLRHLPPQDCHETYLAALPDLKSGRVRGLGLSSTELNHPPSDFKQSYDHAREQGITHLTAHAGEEADVSYMASAIHDIGCIRVDHGIKLPQDPTLLSHFAKSRTLISMCPISNLELKCVSSISQLPVRTYLDAGVPFSINSDDPAYFGGGTYILENYVAVQEAFDLSKGDWKTIVTNSIELSWCAEERKKEMLEVLADVMRRYK